MFLRPRRGRNDRGRIAPGVALPIDASFFVCSFSAMIRIDQQELAAHIDAALSTTPAHRVAQLAGTDPGERGVAIGALTSRLADRLRSSRSTPDRQEASACLPLFEHQADATS